MNQPADSHKQQYDDEIDLIELISKLWQEKWIIIITTALATFAGLIFALTRTPIYEASLELTPPSEAELSSFNQSEYFSLTPTEVFQEYLSILERSSHLEKIFNTQEQLLTEKFKLNNNGDRLNQLTEIRSIKYPNTKKKINDIEPDQYYLLYVGGDRSALQKLLINDAQTAKETVLAKLSLRYRTVIQDKINELERTQNLNILTTKDKLEARKEFALATRNKTLLELEQALKIAQTLKQINPTSISRLASNNNAKQVEINAELSNDQAPIYLRGSKLLQAEIKNLRSLSESIFLDDEILRLEYSLNLLANDREKEELKKLLKEEEYDILLHETTINSPESPIKPNKSVIAIICLIMGGILGLLIAIGRIIYNNTKEKSMS